MQEIDSALLDELERLVTKFHTERASGDILPHEYLEVAKVLRAAPALLKAVRENAALRRRLEEAREIIGWVADGYAEHAVHGCDFTKQARKWLEEKP